MLGAYDDLTAAQSGGDFLKSPYGTSQTQPKGSANSKCSLIYSTTLNDVDLDWMQQQDLQLLNTVYTLANLYYFKALYKQKR